MQNIFKSISVFATIAWSMVRRICGFSSPSKDVVPPVSEETQRNLIQGLVDNLEGNPLSKGLRLITDSAHNMSEGDRDSVAAHLKQILAQLPQRGSGAGREL